MIWCFDIDGVINANPDFFKWWTYQLKKKMNTNRVIILTARNPSRQSETMRELEFFGITYDEIHFMEPELERDYKTQALWKVSKVKELKPHIWLDNDFKVYENVLGVELDTPGTERLLI